MDIPIGASPGPLSFTTSRRQLLVGVAVGLLGGCVPPPSTSPHPGPPGPPPPRPVARLRLWDNPNLIRVERAGRALPAAEGLPLMAGDTVETQYAYAGIDFGQGSTWLDVDTRVRVGSLWLFFGRLFSSVVPPFSLDTEDVTASPEGTSFGGRRNRQTGEWAVVVESGRVRCTGRRVAFQYQLVSGQMIGSLPGRVPPPPRRADLPKEIGWVTRARGRQKPLPRIGAVERTA